MPASGRNKTHLAMFEAFLGHHVPPQPAGPLASQQESRAALSDIKKMTTREVLYHLYKEDGVEVLGRPESVFATYDEELGVLTAFPVHIESVKIITSRPTCLESVFEQAKVLGASFTVSGREVTCQIGYVSAEGTSYGEAALRALLLHQRNTQEQTVSTSAMVTASTFPN